MTESISSEGETRNCPFETGGTQTLESYEELERKRKDYKTFTKQTATQVGP